MMPLPVLPELEKCREKNALCYLQNLPCASICPLSTPVVELCMMFAAQVRHMVGALLSVGAGTLSLDIIAERLALGKTQIPGTAVVHVQQASIYVCDLICTDLTI